MLNSWNNHKKKTKKSWKSKEVVTPAETVKEETLSELLEDESSSSLSSPCCATTDYQLPLQQGLFDVGDEQDQDDLNDRPKYTPRHTARTLNFACMVQELSISNDSYDDDDDKNGPRNPNHSLKPPPFQEEDSSPVSSSVAASTAASLSPKRSSVLPVRQEQDLSSPWLLRIEQLRQSHQQELENLKEKQSAWLVGLIAGDCDINDTGDWLMASDENIKVLQDAQESGDLSMASDSHTNVLQDAGEPSSSESLIQDQLSSSAASTATATATATAPTSNNSRTTFLQQLERQNTLLREENTGLVHQNKYFQDKQKQMKSTVLRSSIQISELEQKNARHLEKTEQHSSPDATLQKRLEEFETRNQSLEKEVEEEFEKSLKLQDSLKRKTKIVERQERLIKNLQESLKIRGKRMSELETKQTQLQETVFKQAKTITDLQCQQIFNDTSTLGGDEEEEENDDNVKTTPPFAPNHSNDIRRLEAILFGEEETEKPPRDYSSGAKQSDLLQKFVQPPSMFQRMGEFMFHSGNNANAPQRMMKKSASHEIFLKY